METISELICMRTDLVTSRLSANDYDGVHTTTNSDVVITSSVIKQGHGQQIVLIILFSHNQKEDIIHGIPLKLSKLETFMYYGWF